MQGLSRICVLVGLLALAGLWGDVPTASGQAGKGEKIRFSTVDDVDIHGTFYSNPKKPAVLLLHKLGEDSRKKGWTGLAEHLHKKGFAVLSFDFRGHGSSTDVGNDFWLKSKFPGNSQGIKPPHKMTIEFKDFYPSYYPALVNDIAAAKAFLERKNDLGECNAASLILIGAEEGATLGALWLNAEWHRFQQKLNPFGVPLAPPESRAEGKDTIAAIWLSVSPKLGSRVVNIPSTLDIPGRYGGTAMIFFYGDGDTKSGTLAQECVKKWKANPKDKDKFKYTDAVKVPGAKLVGINLIQPTLKTDQAISDYLTEVVQARGGEYGERHFQKTHFVWRYPGTTLPVPAKLPNEKMLLYNTYVRFLK